MKQMKHLLLFIGILFTGMALQAQVVVNNNPDPLVVCDDNNNGFAPFDLQQANGDITLNDPSLYVTYHETIPDAQTAVYALASPYMNIVPYFQTVYARVGNSQGDFAIVPLDLIVQELPQITQPIDLVGIDNDGDGVAIFDLTENEALILQGLNPSDYIVSYYETQAEAVAGTPQISNPTAYQNIQNPQTIYVRVEDFNAGCFVVTYFTLILDSLSTDSYGWGDLRLFPNPTSDSFTIQSTQLGVETNVSIYDIRGRMVSSEKGVSQNGTFTLNISSFENGVYFVKISSEGNVAVRKLIKG